MKRALQAVVLATLGAFTMLYLTRTPSGFCAASGVFHQLTTDEMCESAINELIRSNTYSKCFDMSGKPKACPTPYQTLSQFKTLNPNSCRVGYGPEDPRPNSIEWLLMQWRGDEAAYVVLRYYADAEHKNSTQGELPYRINNCGRAISAIDAR